MKTSKPHWWIGQARDALCEGYRVIAHHLNQVIASAKNVRIDMRIDAEAKRPDDSLLNAILTLRETLSAMRNARRLESDDSKFRIWSLGFLNSKDPDGTKYDAGKERFAPREFFVTAGGSCLTQSDLEFRCKGLDHLARESKWTLDMWRENIKLPVERWHLASLKILEDIEADFGANGQYEQIEPGWLDLIVDQRARTVKKAGTLYRTNPPVQLATKRWDLFKLLYNAEGDGLSATAVEGKIKGTSGSRNVLRGKLNESIGPLDVEVAPRRGGNRLWILQEKPT